ncbi:MAG: ABC transporter ATP-binding protein [Candidatus Hodarchaeota archaeon]
MQSLPELADIAIEVNNLTKTFGKGEQKVEAVKRISLSVKRGEIFGFLGPNGAGKTTSLRMIVGLLEPDEGVVKIFGMDPKDGKNTKTLKKLLGIIPQEISLYEELTVEENLWFMAKAYRIQKEVAENRINNLISRLGLDDKRKSLVKNLSGGLKRRVNVIMGLVHDPVLILCDEPTPGLDPQSRVVVWEFIQNLPKEGKTVILTTHFMEEADRLSDRVAIIDHGEILVLNTPKKLKASIGEGDLLEFDLADDSEEHLQKMADLLKGFTTSKGLTVEDAYISESRMVVRALNVIPNLAQILNRIEKHGAVVDNMAIRNTTLEDVFINLTGRALRN